jgi:hypothetical protein
LIYWRAKSIGMLGNKETTSKDIKISSSCRTISITFWIKSKELLALKPSILTDIPYFVQERYLWGRNLQ